MAGEFDISGAVRRHAPTAVVLGLAAIHVYRTMLNHDVAYYLLLARALDEGRQLYSTFPDYGLPANGWLACLSLGASRALSLPLVPTHQALLFVLAATAAVATGHILAGILGRDSVAGRHVTPLCAAVLLLYPGYEFGQRDYLFGVLWGPLVALLAARHLEWGFGRSCSAVAIALASIGGALKPQYCLPLVALAGMELALRRGRLRLVAPELWLTGGALVLYIGLVFLLYPTYFTEVLPLAATVYGGYEGSFDGWLWSNLARALAAAAAALSLARHVWRKSERVPLHGELFACWGGLGLILLVTFVAQRKGFVYHLLPFSMYFALSFGVLVLVALERSSLPEALGLQRVSRLLVAAILVSCVAVALNGPVMSRKGALSDPFGRAVLEIEAGTPILIVSTGVSPQSPFHAYSDLRWTGAFGSLHELPAIIFERDAAQRERRAPRDALRAVERDLRRRMLLSLRDPRPEVVFMDVSASPRWFEHREEEFSVLDFLLEDPRFADAWSAYEPGRQIATVFGPIMRRYELRQ